MHSIYAESIPREKNCWGSSPPFYMCPQSVVSFCCGKEGSFQARAYLIYSNLLEILPFCLLAKRKKQGLEAISTLDNTIADHRIILENEKRTGRPELVLQIQNSIETFLEMRKKMVSELRTMPPCLDPNCTDHTILKTNDLDSDLSNVNDKKQSNKRKIKKQDLEGFAFPKKTVRPTTPTQKKAFQTAVVSVYHIRQKISVSCNSEYGNNDAESGTAKLSFC
ncbi:hypothetical protein TNIN_135161 [Trichonephila inaurata madagascariensis]|uniref:Uncharacterized protein n=1 Tax=Trichonephila inaurata madagascariensis TaxID=2747483 RepID=A0A8X7C5V2_9ARAC|nr:hypothetical protein TNIN_135161 [Trichonephila inaurata madagascariensis]